MVAQVMVGCQRAWFADQTNPKTAGFGSMPKMPTDASREIHFEGRLRSADAN